MTTLLDTITETRAPSYTVDIHIAGDIAIARQVCREFCMEGCCVTVAPSDFIYTGGAEAGIRVGFINYPRFPAEPAAIMERANRLARLLIERLCQQSCCIVAPDDTVWLSRRSWE